MERILSSYDVYYFLSRETHPVTDPTRSPFKCRKQEANWLVTTWIDVSLDFELVDGCLREHLKDNRIFEKPAVRSAANSVFLSECSSVGVPRKTEQRIKCYRMMA